MFLYYAEIAAIAYFFSVWVGYVLYAKRRASTPGQLSLSSSLLAQRRLWAARLLSRDVRVTDAALLANQERVVGFFASATLILVAAVLTAISNAPQLVKTLNQLPLSIFATQTIVLSKLVLLLLILVYAFFKITWALRQYGFISVLMGAAPAFDESLSVAQRQCFIEKLADLMDKAGYDNNSCLRAYYFALATVFWLAGNLPFVLTTTAVVIVLANREFLSPAVACIRDAYVALDVSCATTVIRESHENEVRQKS